MPDRCKFYPGIEVVLGLERNRTAQQPPIQFRQHNVHGEICRRKPARRRSPGLARAACQHDLQDRNIRGIEDGRAIVAQGGECRRIEDDRRPPRCDQLLDTLPRCRVLETGDGDRYRHQFLRVERRHQRMDGSGVRGQQACFVEQDKRNGTLVDFAE